MYSPFRHTDSIFRKKRPIHLTFFLTRRCNAKCPFCFYLKADDTIPHHGTELSMDEIEKISGSMGTLLWLAFSGGEIYLRDDLVDISRIFYRNNKPAIMLFPTNGLLPELISERTEQILRQCSNSIIAVKLSMDGSTGSRHLRNTPAVWKKPSPITCSRGFSTSTRTLSSASIRYLFGKPDKMDEIIDYVNKMESIKTHKSLRGNLSAGVLKRSITGSTVMR
jgi:organic radical activating enzyme